MPKVRVRTVKVADWPKFLAVVFIVGVITVVVHKVVHHLLDTWSH